MAISITGIINALDKLSKPLQTKILKKLGLDMNDLPGRTSKKAGVNVGKERFNRKEIRDQIKGGIKTLGYGTAAYATYSAGDLVNDLLGIKSMGKSTLKADGASGEYTRMPLKDKKPVEKKNVVKKTTPKAPPPKPDSVKKKKQLMMKEKYSGKDSEVKFNSKGGMMKKYNKGGMTKKGKK